MVFLANLSPPKNLEIPLITLTILEYRVKHVRYGQNRQNGQASLHTARPARQSLAGSLRVNISNILLSEWVLSDPVRLLLRNCDEISFVDTNSDFLRS